MSKLDILIADDIYANLFLLSSIIQELGHKSKTVTNGKKVIDELNINNKYKLILLDIEMPVMNGIETACHIRTKMGSEFSEIPIIALTAHNPDDFEDQIQNAKFNDILTKPYSIAKLEKIIDKYA